MNLTSLFEAAKSGDVIRLTELLHADPKLANTESSDGLTPLGFAAHYGHKEAVLLLLNYKADVNAVSHSKFSFIPSNTALHAAIAGERNIDVILILLQHQASTQIFDSNGYTCLHIAAFHNDNQEIIRLLIEHGADVNAKVEVGQTALTVAIEQGNKQVADFLIQNGATE